KLDLKNKVDGVDKVQAQVPADAIGPLYADLNKLKANEKLGSFDTKVTKDSVFVGLLVNLLPIGVLVVLLLLFMSQMQGGGSRARRASRSTRSPGPTSWRCSSASAPPGSVTSSSRPSRTRRPSCSSTRSTRSAGTAAPGSAAGTTSASRRSTSSSWRWTGST